MKIVGLCGGSGSGKGTVAKIFCEYGFMHIDTDAVYHTLTSYPSPCLRELADAFGIDIIKGGKLDRAKLSRIVFSGDGSAERRQILNSIAHKHVLEKTKSLIEKNKEDGAIGVIVDAPLLFEASFDRLCSSVICVVADENIRIKRIMSRDKITEKQAFLRIRTQLPDSYLKERSDYCIENNGSEDELRDNVFPIIKELINKK